MAEWNRNLWISRNPDYKVNDQLSFGDVARQVNAWIPRFAESEAKGATLRAGKETEGVRSHAPEHYQQLGQYNPAFSQIMPSLDQARSSLGVMARRQEQEGLGPSRIEAEMEGQAYRGLGLGGQLTPEEQRMAEQQARAAFASRGLLNSRPAAAAEVLNRQNLAEERKRYRRDFAGTVDQMRLGRRGQDMNEGLALAGAQQGLAGLTTDIAQSPLYDPYGRVYGAYSKPGGDVSSALTATNQAFATGTNLALGAERNRLAQQELQQNALIDLERRKLSHATSIQFPRMESVLDRGHDMAFQGNQLAFEREKLAAEVEMAHRDRSAKQSASKRSGWMSLIGGIISDKRLKKNVKAIGKDPDTGLKVYKYDWTQTGKALGGERQGNVGYIAQDVEKKYPEAVARGPDGYKRINHQALGKEAA